MISFRFLLYQPVLTSYYLVFTTGSLVQMIKLETGFDWLWLVVIQRYYMQHKPTAPHIMVL